MKIGIPKDGRFGDFGGKYIPETLAPAIEELEKKYMKIRNDKAFKKELKKFLIDYAGRPTPLYFAKNLTKRSGGAKIYLKREDLLHGGAHKINNTFGQALLAKKMGKKRIIAETGAGQHGVATAMACSCLGLEAEIYMGYVDTERQKQNVFRMELLGAKVHSVKSGSQTLKDAINEAMRDWITNVESTYYLLGSAVGPHPYPLMVRDFQSVIGNEIKKQMKKIPNTVIACVGGGSNAIGTFYPLIETKAEIIGIEAGGKGLNTLQHSAPLSAGTKGVLHGMMTYLMQDKQGQIQETHSISAGLDYPGVGPEHSWLKDTGRAEYVSVTDIEAIQAFHDLCQIEGIIPALDSSHAIAYTSKIAPKMDKNEIIVVNLSGRGDKDIQTVATHEGITI